MLTIPIINDSQQQHTFTYTLSRKEIQAHDLRVITMTIDSIANIHIHGILDCHMDDHPISTSTFWDRRTEVIRTIFHAHMVGHAIDSVKRKDPPSHSQ